MKSNCDTAHSFFNIKELGGKILLSVLIGLSLSFSLFGCSGGDVSGSTSTASTTGGSSTPSGGYTVFLGVSQNTLKTGNSDSATIKATLVKNNVAQPGTTVTFATTDGILLTNTATTDSNGEASVTLKSGPVATNQTISVSATSNGAAASIPLKIIGNDLTLSITQSNIATSNSETLKATVKNGEGIGIANAVVSFTLNSGAGVVSLTPATAITDASGEASITVKGLTAGSAEIQADCFGAIGKVQVTVSPATQVFEISSPDVSVTPASFATTGYLDVTVNAPSQSQVTFYSSIGIWNGIDNEETVNVVNGLATARLTSVAAGTASITVYDPASPATQDNLQANIYAPASEAFLITLQASKNSVAITPAGSTSSNTVNLTAIVRNVDGYAVGGALVNFNLSNTSGGGEYLNPAIAVTDSSGVAKTTFYSGSRGSGASGVRVTATVQGTLIAANEDIVITNLAASVALGLANKIVILSDTTYQQDITIQVSDANGSPVQSTDVSLNLWPYGYLLGGRAYDINGTCIGYAADIDCNGNYIQPNEDANKNLILDIGPPVEDSGPMDNNGVWGADGFLTPPSSSGGSVPATVTTDANGMATFQITFLKRYAHWVAVQLTATAQVGGTETYAEMKWVLPAEKGESEACNLFDSPFGSSPGVCYNTGP